MAAGRTAAFDGLVAGATPGRIMGLVAEAKAFILTVAKAAVQISEAQAHLAGEGWMAALAILNPGDR